jgi:translation initiation factor 2 alpha subunit (eIF-2alpha)
LIKSIFKGIKDIDLRYLSAGKYSLKTESEDPKTADQKLTDLIRGIEKKAKKQGMEFSIGKK